MHRGCHLHICTCFYACAYVYTVSDVQMFMLRLVVVMIIMAMICHDNIGDDVDDDDDDDDGGEGFDKDDDW